MDFVNAHQDLFDKDLSTYPEGFMALRDTLGFLGPAQDVMYGTFLLFLTMF